MKIKGKIKGKDLALYYSLSEQTISNYKNSKEVGYRRQYEALKSHYANVLSNKDNNDNDTNVSKKKGNKIDNYTMDFQRNQVYIYGDISISDIERIKPHFEDGVVLCINASFDGDEWMWDYNIPLEWN